MSPPHLALFFAISLIWGFNLVAGKIGVTEFPPQLFTAMRFGVLALVLAPWLRLQPGQMPAVLGVGLSMGALHFGLLYGGLALAGDVSTVAILIQLHVPFATVLSVMFLGERVGMRRWSGIVLAFGGVMILGFDPGVLGYAGAVGLVILAALASAVGFLLMKRLRGVGVFELQAWIATLSLPLLVGASAVVERGQWDAAVQASALGWGAVLFTALAASLMGHGGAYYLLQRYPVSLVAPLTLLATVFAVVFGVLLLEDNLTPRMLLGAAVTLGGVIIVLLRQRD